MAFETDPTPSSQLPRGRSGTIEALRLGLALLCLPSACAFTGGSPEAPAAPIFFPGLPREPRIQFLTAVSARSDVFSGPGWFERLVLGEPENPRLGKIYGVALHDGKIFACDTAENVVVVFDLAGGSVSLLGDHAPGRLMKPINIAVDEDGTRYVADTELKRVLVYDDSNRYLTAHGNPDAWSPSDVAIDGDRLYVADVKNGQVVMLDKASGDERRRIGRKGSGRNELFFPTNLATDSEGNLYVSDTGNFRILKFDRQGRQIQQFGALGDSLGRFARPKGIAVDRAGRLYAVDAAFENVQIFDESGELLLFFGSPGNGPGELNLPAQVEIAYDGVGLFADRVAPGFQVDYLILVSSQYGPNKVNVYGFLRRNGEPDRAAGRGNR